MVKNTAPFSVKHVTHAFLQHEIFFLSTINEVIEPYPSPLKELVNRKYRYKLQENCTKLKKWKQNKPQPFRVLSAKDKKIHKWWRDLRCVLFQNPRNSNNIFDTFCLNQLCSQPLTWPRGGRSTQEHKGLFPRNPHWTPQSVSGPQEAEAHTPWFLCSLCLMHSWSLGPGVIYFRVVPRVATEQDRLVGRLFCLIWNWCFCVILWKVPFSRGESSTDITHNALIYIQQIAHWHGK